MLLVSFVITNYSCGSYNISWKIITMSIRKKCSSCRSLVKAVYTLKRLPVARVHFFKFSLKPLSCWVKSDLFLEDFKRTHFSGLLWDWLHSDAFCPLISEPFTSIFVFWSHKPSCLYTPHLWLWKFFFLLLGTWWKMVVIFLVSISGV